MTSAQSSSGTGRLQYRVPGEIQLTIGMGISHCNSSFQNLPYLHSKYEHCCWCTWILKSQFIYFCNTVNPNPTPEVLWIMWLVSTGRKDSQTPLCSLTVGSCCSYSWRQGGEGLVRCSCLAEHGPGATRKEPLDKTTKLIQFKVHFHLSMIQWVSLPPVPN